MKRPRSLQQPCPFKRARASSSARRSRRIKRKSSTAETDDDMIAQFKKMRCTTPHDLDDEVDVLRGEVRRLQASKREAEAKGEKLQADNAALRRRVEQLERVLAAGIQYVQGCQPKGDGAQGREPTTAVETNNHSIHSF